MALLPPGALTGLHMLSLFPSMGFDIWASQPSEPGARPAMNILTYASPVALKPVVYAIG